MLYPGQNSQGHQSRAELWVLRGGGRMPAWRPEAERYGKWERQAVSRRLSSLALGSNSMDK